MSEQGDESPAPVGPGPEGFRWGLPDGYNDSITSIIDIRCGWRDRLKCLCGWTFHVRVRTFTERTVGRVLNEPVEVTDTAPDWWPWKKRCGVATRDPTGQPTAVAPEGSPPPTAT